MLNEEVEIAETLAGGMLEGRRVEELHFGGPPALAPEPAPAHERVYVVACDASEIDSAWRAAAAVVDETGRWPIATVSLGDEPLASSLWGSIGSIDSLPEPLSEPALDDRVGAIVEQRDSVFTMDDNELQHHLNRTSDRVGRAPSVDDVREALGPAIGDIELNRWLFDWELEQLDGQLGSYSDSHLMPYRPASGAAGVVLLPVAEPWKAAALMGFYGVDSVVTDEVYISLLHRWNRRWHAAVTTHFGTLLDFQVGNPPTTAQDLLALSIEQAVLAQCTTLLPGVSIRDHARALADRSSWHLHERP